jgi:hypothetical protein
MAEITEFGDEEDESSTDKNAKTHGYEGDFKVGDKVRVIKHIKIWSVKQYSKAGFDAFGFAGTVNSLVLYGRKHQSLCSAITPIKVEFSPDGEGIPQNMFERKWLAHFDKNELQLISDENKN